MNGTIQGTREDGISPWGVTVVSVHESRIGLHVFRIDYKGKGTQAGLNPAFV